jgi:hypothetical protein
MGVEVLGMGTCALLFFLLPRLLLLLWSHTHTHSLSLLVVSLTHSLTEPPPDVVSCSYAGCDPLRASAPIFAGIASLLADVSMNNGGPALGLMTPMMYEVAKSHPAAFTDIVWGEVCSACWLM